jgi:hypothetical protein
LRQTTHQPDLAWCGFVGWSSGFVGWSSRFLGWTSRFLSRFLGWSSRLVTCDEFGRARKRRAFTDRGE